MGLLGSLSQPQGFRSTSAAQVLQLCLALMSERGEVAGLRLAQKALGAYVLLPDAEVESFFDSLTRDFSPNPGRVLGAAQRCATYLLHAKRADTAPLDPVARFHLANGARLQRINWLGDTSTAGMRRAFGLTVNYVYDLNEVEANHDAYARNFEIVAAPALKRLALPRRGAKVSATSPRRE